MPFRIQVNMLLLISIAISLSLESAVVSAFISGSLFNITLGGIGIVFYSIIVFNAPFIFIIFLFINIFFRIFLNNKIKYSLIILAFFNLSWTVISFILFPDGYLVSKHLVHIGVAVFGSFLSCLIFLLLLSIMDKDRR